ncbi:MAG: hypothetical protein MZV70_22475 [Desulfobacterales bacterium]|nr:hypothetical protein [Desulfobacterales bacterium]
MNPLSAAFEGRGDCGIPGPAPGHPGPPRQRGRPAAAVGQAFPCPCRLRPPGAGSPRCCRFRL